MEKPPEAPLHGQKFLIGPAFNDATPVQDINAVCDTNSRKVMAYEQHRPSVRGLPKATEKMAFRDRVHGRCRFIQE